MQKYIKQIKIHNTRYNNNGGDLAVVDVITGAVLSATDLREINGDVSHLSEFNWLMWASISISSRYVCREVGPQKLCCLSLQFCICCVQIYAVLNKPQRFGIV
jgi:hypothetical protein